jgi:hypothetical protein
MPLCYGQGQIYLYPYRYIGTPLEDPSGEQAFYTLHQKITFMRVLSETNKISSAVAKTLESLQI